MIERRWGAVVVPVTEGGKVLMIPDTSDNPGKTERSWFDEEMRKVEGYQFPGGAIEDGETMEGGAIRELLEETGLSTVNVDRLAELMVNADIVQNGRKGCGENRFGVRIFELVVTKDEERILKESGGAVEVSGINEAGDIRPRDRVIRVLYDLVKMRVNGFRE